MRTTDRQISASAVFALLLSVVVPTQADASELSAGISFGGIQAGTVTRLAVSPHAGISWRINGDIILNVHDLLSVIPPVQIGVGEHRVPRPIGEDRGPMIGGVHRSPPVPTPIWATLASAA
ncbi:hypothetical protein [Sorangium sp. So ce204]|uniref:hypothetical protein n=1 Tax=Sorangium sp. So ce204 TaxID=3133288 RepID=UPI003F648A1C